jgi:hypothetical protein
MNAIVRTLSVAGAVCVLAGNAWAADGVLLVQKVTAAGGPAVTHQIQIDAHRMRMETGGGPGGGQVFVFDGTRQVMLMINDTTKSYSEITKADLDNLSAQMSSVMSQMQEAMKNMPPEQRAKMEAAMRGRMGGAGAATPAPKPHFTKVGTGTAGKWTCDRYESTNAGQKTELCTVDPKVLGVGLSDLAVTKDLAAFFQKMMPGNAAQVFQVGSLEDQGFSGVPVRTVVTTANGQTITSEITDVHRQAFSDATFAPPAGYQKQASPFGRGRGGQQ